MYCNNCGANINTNDMYCANCGTKISAQNIYKPKEQQKVPEVSDNPEEKGYTDDKVGCITKLFFLIGGIMGIMIITDLTNITPRKGDPISMGVMLIGSFIGVFIGGLIGECITFIFKKNK